MMEAVICLFHIKFLFVLQLTYNYKGSTIFCGKRLYLYFLPTTICGFSGGKNEGNCKAESQRGEKETRIRSKSCLHAILVQ